MRQLVHPLNDPSGPTGHGERQLGSEVDTTSSKRRAKKSRTACRPRHPKSRQVLHRRAHATTECARCTGEEDVAPSTACGDLTTLPLTGTDSVSTEERTFSLAALCHPSMCLTVRRSVRRQHRKPKIHQSLVHEVFLCSR